MIAFKREESKIVITINGDEDYYVDTMKTLLFIIGNQNPANPLKPDEIAGMMRLLAEMLPSVENLKTERQSA